MLWFGFPSYQRICPADPCPPGFLLPIKKRRRAPRCHRRCGDWSVKESGWRFNSRPALPRGEVRKLQVRRRIRHRLGTLTALINVTYEATSSTRSREASGDAGAVSRARPRAQARCGSCGRSAQHQKAAVQGVAPSKQRQATCDRMGAFMNLTSDFRVCFDGR